MLGLTDEEDKCCVICRLFPLLKTDLPVMMCGLFHQSIVRLFVSELSFLIDGHNEKQLFLSFCFFACLLLQGFLDIDLTDLRKGGANITGFQLVNNSEPSVSRVVQQWMEFDIKDSKMPKSGLKVLLLIPHLFSPFAVHLSPLGVWVATVFCFGLVWFFALAVLLPQPACLFASIMRVHFRKKEL